MFCKLEDTSIPTLLYLCPGFTCAFATTSCLRYTMECHASPSVCLGVLCGCRCFILKWVTLLLYMYQESLVFLLSRLAYALDSNFIPKVFGIRDIISSSISRHTWKSLAKGRLSSCVRLALVPHGTPLVSTRRLRVPKLGSQPSVHTASSVLCSKCVRSSIFHLHPFDLLFGLLCFSENLVRMCRPLLLACPS
jgi:hypothetical protein